MTSLIETLILDSTKKNFEKADTFTTHTINLRSATALRATFAYSFRMQSIYLIDGRPREV